MLGLDLSFAADVPPERIQKAVDYVHQRYRDLQGRSGQLSKERLLTYLALSLADDYLHDQGKLMQLETTLQQLLSKIDSPEKKIYEPWEVSDWRCVFEPIKRKKGSFQPSCVQALDSRRSLMDCSQPPLNLRGSK